MCVWGYMVKCFLVRSKHTKQKWHVPCKRVCPSPRLFSLYLFAFFFSRTHQRESKTERGQREGCGRGGSEPRREVASPPEADGDDGVPWKRVCMRVLLLSRPSRAAPSVSSAPGEEGDVPCTTHAKAWRTLAGELRGESSDLAIAEPSVEEWEDVVSEYGGVPRDRGSDHGAALIFSVISADLLSSWFIISPSNEGEWPFAMAL